jgi:MFS family permease
VTYFISDVIPVGRRVSAKGWLLAVLLVGPFMSQADATIANVATPSIHADLGASAAALELVIGGYLLTFSVLLITGARLGQTHGYRRVFLAGIATFGLASLACGLAPDPTLLVVARVLQGISAALMFPQALTGIQLNFEGAERVRAIGLYAIALSVGAVSGQILGGALVSANIAGSHWRAIFLINVPIAAITVAAALRYLPADEPRASKAIDLVGVAALTASAALIVLPLVLGRAEGWPVWTWLCLAAAGPAFALFLATQRRVAARGEAPLINVAVLARPAVGWALLALLAATATYYALLFTLAQYLQVHTRLLPQAGGERPVVRGRPRPGAVNFSLRGRDAVRAPADGIDRVCTYLQTGLGQSALVSGLTLVPWVAAFGVAGQLVRRLPARLLALAPAAGCLLLTAAYSAISLMLFAGSHGEGLLIGLLAAGGLGLGINFSALIAHLTTAVPSGYAPDVSGVSSTTAAIGGTLGVAAFGTLYLSLSHAGTADATHSFAIITATFAIAALTAAAAARRATQPPAKS